MRKLSSTETYIGSRYFEPEIKKAPATKQELDVVVNSGYIAPSLLSDSVEKIKKTPVFADAEKYLSDGRITLLNPQGNNGEFMLGIRVPFFMVGPKMYVNMTRWGRWQEEKSMYSVSPASELSPIVQGAYVTYKFIENYQKLLNDPKILDLSTRIYVEVMVRLLKSFGINLSDSAQDDNTTYIRYLCSKFFLLYVLEKEESVSISELAYKVAKTSSMNKMSLDLLQMREDGDGYLTNPEQYGSLYGFLSSIMSVTRSNIEISSALVLSKFAFLYGEQAYHSINYFPYLIYFLEIATKGTILRNKIISMRSLNIFVTQLEKEILAKS